LAPAARRRTKDLEAVHPGQRTSRTDEVRAPCVVAIVEALSPGPGDRDLVALLLEGVLDARGDRVLVFDDEDGGCHGAGCYTDRRPNAVTSRVAASWSCGDPWYPSAAYRAPPPLRPAASAARSGPAHRS
jgi:hypothetical protein